MTKIAVRITASSRSTAAPPLFSLMDFIHKQRKFISLKDYKKVGLKVIHKDLICENRRSFVCISYTVFLFTVTYYSDENVKFILCIRCIMLMCSLGAIGIVDTVQGMVGDVEAHMIVADPVEAHGLV